MKKVYIKIFSLVISLYLSFCSLILVRIITDGIILNSYKTYSKIKINSNKVMNTMEKLSEKGKVIFNKILDYNKSLELEKKYKEEELLKEKEIQELKNKLEFNQKVLSGLPYVIAFIIFLISFIKINDYLTGFIEHLGK